MLRAQSNLLKMFFIFLAMMIVGFFVPKIVKADCVPGEGCGSCVSNRCSNGDQCATGNYYCIWDATGNYCSTSCTEEVNNCSTQCSTSDGGTSYSNNCGAAATCASLGKTGDAGDIVCTNSCTSSTNTCKTTGACDGSTACTVDSDCPSNLSCPTGCSISNGCDLNTGGCYSRCTNCPTEGGGGDGDTCPTAGTVPACRTTGGSVPNGSCGTTTYTANCSGTCTGDACNPLPGGVLDGANCNTISGWACDSSDYNQSIDVHLYNGTAWLGAAPASNSRTDLPGAGVCGGTTLHGFSFSTPDNLKNGASYTINAYGIDYPDPDAHSTLGNSPATLNCILPPVISAAAPACTYDGTATSSVTLSWAASTGAGYYLLKIDNNAEIRIDAPTVSYAFDTNPLATYSWQLKACNALGCSAPINGTNFRCMPAPCPPPAGDPAGSLGACGDSNANFDRDTIGNCNGAWSHNPGTATAPLAYNSWCAINANPTRGYCYQCTSASNAWVQVTGDIHANGSISLPGGP